MKTENPTIKEIQDHYYYYHCTITLVNGTILTGNFRHNAYKISHIIKGWYFTSDGNQNIITILHDQIAIIQRLD